MSKATNVEALRIMNGNKLEAVRAHPGAFYYYMKESFGEGAGIVHSCPCGCGQLCALNLDPSEEGRPCWHNSGTEDRPTLTPSVGIRPWNDQVDVEADGYHWHGWLRNGVWESC